MERVTIRPERKPSTTGTPTGAVLRLTAMAVMGATLLAASVNAARVKAHNTPAPPHHQQAPTGATTMLSPQRALLDQYCVTCHNTQLQTAGLMLDTLDVDDVSASPQVWEKVVAKLRSGQMPPVGRPRPDATALTDLVSSIEQALDHAWRATPNYGRPATVHRLNRAEYTNAVRDLFSLDVDGRALLPPDDSGYGFDNIGDVLTVSQPLLERYMLAASKVAWLVIGNPATRLAATSYRSTDVLQEDRSSEDLPFGSRGGFAIRHTFPLDGEYVIRPSLERASGYAAKGGVHRLQIRFDHRLMQEYVVDSSKPESTRNIELRLPVTAGTHLVSASFVGGVYLRLPRDGGRAEAPPPSAYVFKGYPIDPIIPNIDVIGPYEGVAPRDTASRRQIFVCYPASAAEELPCAREILGTIARRAYRRPVVAADIDPLLAVYKAGSQTGGFEAGVELALEGILASPKFLFRIERDPADTTPGAPYRVSDLDLASRLSFFLWSTIPDETLLDLATRGRLSDPAVLAQQVKRMLADSRSKALTTNFGGQWLWQRNLRTVAPSADLFVDFDERLRDAFAQETEMFLENQIREDRSAIELLTADYTFLNERLARLYEIPGVYGSHFRRVHYPDDRRAGLLGHASILTVTSHPNRTSPVVRGKWLLETLLGVPPPPPPPDVPPLQENGEGAAAATVRERLEQHRKNPVCASCHARIDPLGFALENFDAIGRWRTEDGESGTHIDASGVLPDGTQFSGPAEFRTALLSKKTEFVTNLTEKLLTYALGRGTEYYDAPVVRGIVRSASAADYQWSSIILGIVQSKPFQMRMAAVNEEDSVARTSAAAAAR